MPKDADIIVLPARSKYYWHRTESDMQRLYDSTRGQLNSAGESYVYNGQGLGFLDEATVVTITRRRGIEWRGWGKRPTFLVEGLATINGLPRIIYFQHH